MSELTDEQSERIIEAVTVHVERCTLEGDTAEEVAARVGYMAALCVEILASMRAGRLNGKATLARMESVCGKISELATDLAVQYRYQEAERN